MKILIDNEHDQETAGKRNPDGRLLEWSYNREIAARVVGVLLMLLLYFRWYTVLLPFSDRLFGEGFLSVCFVSRVTALFEYE